MDHAIIACHEEEFAPFFMYSWRRAAGWHAVWLYGRGPGGLGPISSILLTMIGVWRFARVPHTLKGNESLFIGQCVRSICPYLGSYGMGGPGFLGLRFATGKIVYSLWAADGWLTLDRKLIQDSLFPNERMQYDPAHLVSINTLNGAMLESIECGPETYALVFSKDGQQFQLSLRRDGRGLPVWRGNGRPKVFAADERLENAIIISRIGRLWLLQ